MQESDRKIDKEKKEKELKEKRSSKENDKENHEDESTFGGIPSRNLKKNLGCGG
jgi:hypothetical protein